MMTLPPEFIKTIRGGFGLRGEEWLREFPTLLRDICVEWDITLTESFNLSFNFVAAALRSGQEEVVLKLGVPNRELDSEAAALQYFNGQGAVQLLESDLERGALLLERVRPGKPLYELRDDYKAALIAADMMRRLHRPLPAEHPFVTLSRWTAGLRRLRETFQGGTGPFPLALVERAEQLLVDLLATSGTTVLLHGDLHHWNILSAQRQPWLALDPKGVAGEAEYEVGVFLYNPMPEIASWTNLEKVLVRRLDIFSSELGFDRERLLAWGLVEAVLSAWWSYEDRTAGMEAALVVAESLARLISPPRHHGQGG